MAEFKTDGGAPLITRRRGAAGVRRCCVAKTSVDLAGPAQLANGRLASALVDMLSILEWIDM